MFWSVAENPHAIVCDNAANGFEYFSNGPNKVECVYVQNSLEGGREGVLTGVEAVRVLMRRKTGWRRCLL